MYNKRTGAPASSNSKENTNNAVNDQWNQLTMDALVNQSMNNLIDWIIMSRANDRWFDHNKYYNQSINRLMTFEPISTAVSHEV